MDKPPVQKKKYKERYKPLSKAMNFSQQMLDRAVVIMDAYESLFENQKVMVSIPVES